MEKQTRKDVVLDIITNHPDGLLTHEIESIAKQFYMTAGTAMRHLRTLRRDREVYYTRQEGRREVLWLPTTEQMKEDPEHLTRLILRRSPHDTYNQNLPEGITCGNCISFDECHKKTGRWYREFKDEWCVTMEFRLKTTDESRAKAKTLTREPRRRNTSKDLRFQNLPEGMTCGDCKEFFTKCHPVFGYQFKDEICRFFPNNFQPKK